MGEPYELRLTDVPTPRLPGRVTVVSDPDKAHEQAIAWLVERALDAVSQRGRCRLGLTDATASDRLLTLLCIDPRWRVIPWPDIELRPISPSVDAAAELVARLEADLLPHVPGVGSLSDSLILNAPDRCDLDAALVTPGDGLARAHPAAGGALAESALVVAIGADQGDAAARLAASQEARALGLARHLDWLLDEPAAAAAG